MITIILWFYLIFFEKHVRDEAVALVFSIRLHAAISISIWIIPA